MFSFYNLPLTIVVALIIAGWLAFASVVLSGMF